MKQYPLPFLTVKSRTTVNPTIHIVPLVDVLLVLLVILLVTAPALLHTVRTKLPHAAAEPATPPRETVTLTLTASGTLLWNGEPLPRDALPERLAALVTDAHDAAPPPVLLAVERTVPFEAAAQLMVALTQAGITDARFLLDPASP
ncbi:ExbD/TolR family protein [Hydrogenophilus thermoluteolus]|uniref:Biopolymer transporter ExbD n=1 Tax=Hydrogenophilus thermoluteolus TaxID=297 RepID=A0A2Z6E091_HYDTE|nr:biopolymer transporter ExbD [Hydrogenophilus thermoluteolus]BBD78201.1 biopolymer transporter ExbD [Hydrogenophilus thermoluteolus]